MVYLDDVMVMGKTFDEHLHNLRKVFDELQNANLKLKKQLVWMILVAEFCICFHCTTCFL